VEFLICGDKNTDYIIERIPPPPKKNTSPLLTTYNLLHTVNFATGIQSNSNTSIDNIFLDNSRIHLSTPSPLIYGLSGRSA
jgi:hypothetical protein